MFNDPILNNVHKNIEKDIESYKESLDKICSDIKKLEKLLVTLGIPDDRDISLTLSFGILFWCKDRQGIFFKAPNGVYFKGPGISASSDMRLIEANTGTIMGCAGWLPTLLSTAVQSLKERQKPGMEASL